MSATINPRLCNSPSSLLSSSDVRLGAPSTLTLIVVKSRWRLFAAVTWSDGGSRTEVCTSARTHPRHLYSIISVWLHLMLWGDGGSSRVIFSGRMRCTRSPVHKCWGTFVRARHL